MADLVKTLLGKVRVPWLWAASLLAIASVISALAKWGGQPSATIIRVLEAFGASGVRVAAVSAWFTDEDRQTLVNAVIAAGAILIIASSVSVYRYLEYFRKGKELSWRLNALRQDKSPIPGQGGFITDVERERQEHFAELEERDEDYQTQRTRTSAAFWFVIVVLAEAKALTWLLAGGAVALLFLCSLVVASTAQALPGEREDGWRQKASSAFTQCGLAARALGEVLAFAPVVLFMVVTGRWRQTAK